MNISTKEGRLELKEEISVVEQAKVVRSSRNWSRDILISIIGSIIFWGIQSHFDKFMNPLFKYFEWLYVSSVDAAFANAVVATNFIIYSYFSLFLNIISGAAVGGIAFVILNTMKLLFKIEPDKSGVPKIGDRISKFRVFLNLLVVLALCLWLYGNYLQLYLIEISIQANATFERRIMALQTVITVEEKARFMRDWSFVMSKKDYEGLMKLIEEMAESKKISIPKRFV